MSITEIVSVDLDNFPRQTQNRQRQETETEGSAHSNALCLERIRRKIKKIFLAHLAAWETFSENGTNTELQLLRLEPVPELDRSFISQGPKDEYDHTMG
jgi:hypothetical protein